MNQELEQAVVKYGNDTWEDGYGQGVYEEQERIIKLLEADLCINSGFDHCVGLNLEHCEYVNQFIALIKGEK